MIIGSAFSSDYKLAAFCYWKAGINFADFQSHWNVDSGKHGNLLKGARAAYLKIWRSYHAEGAQP